MSVLEEKSSFKVLGLSFSSKLDSNSYVVCTAKTASKKIVALIRFIEFLSPEVALYLYMGGHVWEVVPSCYLDMLDEIKKRICCTACPKLAAFFELLAHR